MGVRDDAEAMAPELAGLRRAIHREPEIGLDLPGTQRKVLAALDGLPLEISRGPRSARSPRCCEAGARRARAAGRSSCCGATWTPCR